MSGVKNKSRTLKFSLSRAKTALWFADSSWLNIPSINVTKKTTGIAHFVPAAQASTMAPGTDGGSSTERSSTERKGKGERNVVLSGQILCPEILSDEFYHDVTMLETLIPRLYLIKQRRDQQNKILL